MTTKEKIQIAKWDIEYASRRIRQWNIFLAKAYKRLEKLKKI